ncbi:hypothetical protein [Streptomyces sp. NPDC050287]|uniref:hypothetical protein n=1 Tax=Streptomyces sp. NPDC050287 TaxID=3365608 RepID=UPI00379A89CC
MAFGVEELRVLRRALALALNPTPASAEDVQACLRLAESLDEATREGARMRAFLVADLARYRAALPGTAAGFLALLEEALGAGHRPDPDDLAGLRALRGNPLAAALLDRCEALVERDVRARLSRNATRLASCSTPAVPASRTRLLALPGGRSAARDDHPAGWHTAERDATNRAAKDPAKEPARKPPQKPAERPERPERPDRPQRPGAPEPSRPAAPEPPGPAGPKPARPIPTPGEVFPRRKPATPPSATPPRQLVVAG